MSRKQFLNNYENSKNVILEKRYFNNVKTIRYLPV